jgi:flagellar hook-associated protein 3 FlgL
MGTTAVSQRFISDLRGSNSRLAEIQRQLSTLKRVNTPSDDPVGVALAMSLRRDVEATEAWRSNAEDGVAWLKTTDTALASGIEVIQRVRELAVQGANGALPQNARNTIALEVEGLTSSLIEVGNTSYGGRFIFGGATYDQSPLDATGAPTTGNTAAVSREVGRGQVVQINVTIDEFRDPDGAGGVPDVFTTLGDLVTALQGGDQAGISAAIADLDEHLENFNDLRGRGAGTQRRLEETLSRSDLIQTNARERIGKIEDVDLAQAITELKTRESGLQAALSVGSRIIPLTLVDFLR